MTNDALEFLQSAGVPSASFLEIGTVHKGTVRSYEKSQQRDMDTGQPKCWDDGSPMWQIVFTLQTEENNPEIEDDDGMRKVYAKAQMLNAIRQAVKKSGHKGDLVGGTLGVKYVRDDAPKKRGFSGAKVYAAQFEPPKQTDDLGEPEPEWDDDGGVVLLMPLGGAPPIDLDFFPATFWEKVDVRELDECWLWKQSCGSHGYGQTWDGITVRLAHRCAWELTNGSIEGDLTVDHICRVKRCCNPSHLRLMENVDNARDNGFWKKTHCKRGHEFTPENTRRDQRGHRKCIACQKIHNDARYKGR